MKSYPLSYPRRIEKVLDDPNLQHEPDDEDDEQEWIVTFADLSMLLLVFFILLYSMSSLDIKRFTDSFTSVRSALGEKESSNITAYIGKDEGAIVDSVRLQRQLIEDQRRTYSEVRTFMNRKGIEGIVGAVFDEGVITLQVPGAAIFKPGEVQITDEGKKLLMNMKELFIQRNDQVINIRGYTDDIPPPPDSRFKDNWEISALRAVNVLRFLMQQGIEASRLTATGLGDMDPLYPNTSDDNRSRNRRVEFIMEKRIAND